MAQLDWSTGPLRLLSCPSRTLVQPHLFRVDGVVQELPSLGSQHGPTTPPRLTGPDRIPMRPAYYPTTGLDRPDKCCAASGRARASEEMRRGQPPSSRTRGSLRFSRPRLTGQPPPSCSLPCPACKVPGLSLMPPELVELPPRGTLGKLLDAGKRVIMHGSLQPVVLLQGVAASRGESFSHRHPLVSSLLE